MGIVSPEIFNAFPRRSGEGGGGLSARDAVATGFESTFSYRRMSAEQDQEIDRVFKYFAPSFPHPFDQSQPFGTLPIGQQSLILLMRAFVGNKKVLILDEVFAGMDEKTVGLAKRYLREELRPEQAVVFVSHWEEEVPWSGDELKRMYLTPPSET